MQQIEPREDIAIRAYRSADAAATLTVFLEAVMTTAAADYSPEQVAAWARPEQRRHAEWDRAMNGRSSYVAVVDGEVAGFSDVSAAGYIDMMFVAPRHAHRGVGRALLGFLEAMAATGGAKNLSADVSVTARPFFERFGFVTQAEQHPVTAGVRMTNFHMTKSLLRACSHRGANG